MDRAKATSFIQPSIRTITLGVAIAISVSFIILAICVDRWWLSPYYATTFMNNVRATACAEEMQQDIFVNIREAGKAGEPACVTSNSRRLILEDLENEAEKDFLPRGVR